MTLTSRAGAENGMKEALYINNMKDHYSNSIPHPHQPDVPLPKRQTSTQRVSADYTSLG